MTGSRQLKLRSDNAHNSRLRRLRRFAMRAKMFASFARTIKTANAHFD
jgi:hypothetical protein